MKNTIKFVLFGLFAVTSLNVAASQPFSQQDTLSFINRFIVKENINYIGYRLYISDIEKIKEKRGKIYFSFSLTNTGKEEIKLEKGINTLPIVFRTERKFSTSELSAYKNSITKAILLNLNMSIDIAEQKKEIEIAIPKIDIIPQKNKTNEEQIVILDEQKTQSTTTETDDTTITTPQPEITQVNQTIPNIVKIKDTTTDKSVEPEEATLTEIPTAIPTNENTAIKTKLPKEVAEKVKNDDVPSSKVPDTTQETVNKTQETPKEINTKNENQEEEEIRYQDLTFENIKILKRKKKWVLIEFSIKNIGNETVNLIGDPEIEEDNLAIRAYFSGTPRLSRGAIVTGGMFFDKERKNPDSAFLKPGQTITKTLKVDTKMRTRYLKVLIFAIDPFNAIDESNRKNNTTHVILK